MKVPDSESSAVTESDVTIVASDGVTLAATTYSSVSDGHLGAVVILPATGVTQLRYREYARFLATQGWFVLTFDYRGIGRSRRAPWQVDASSMQAWGERDLESALRWLVDLGHSRIVAVGHSIGGQILPLAASHDRIDAVLTVGAQKGNWRLWDAPNKYLVYAFFRLYIPLCLRLFGYVPLRWIGLDGLAAGVARDYARWTLRLDYAAADETPLTWKFAQFRAPILALSFSDDTKYAPCRAVDFLMRHYYLNAPVWRCDVNPQSVSAAALGHSGFFAATCPHGLWQETARWLEHASRAGSPESFRFRVLRKVWRMTDKQPLSARAPSERLSRCARQQRGGEVAVAEAMNDGVRV